MLVRSMAGSTTARTAQPRSSSALAMAEPMKPVAPVTQTWSERPRGRLTGWATQTFSRLRALLATVRPKSHASPG